MKMQHPPWHWAAVAAVLVIALLTLSDAHGQRSGSAAGFEGRPAIAGAQSGLGAMSGPPQGGVAPQSTEDAGGGIALPRPGPGDASGPAVPRDPGVDRPAPRDKGLQPRRDRDDAVVPRRERDAEVVPRDRHGNAIDPQRTPRKAERATRRSIERARRGVSGVDSE